MRKLIIFLSLFPFLALHAQEQFSLDSLMSLAVENYPKIRETAMIDQKKELAESNHQSSWLPQISLNAQATYQSEVTKIDIPVPNLNIPELSKDQYKIYLEMSQLIYDGGSLKHSRELEEANAQTEHRAIAVELYNLKRRIKELFLQVIMLENSKELIIENINSLDARIKEVDVGIQNGAVLSSVGDNLRAGKIKSQQILSETNFTQEGLLDMLSHYCGIQLTQTELQQPDAQFSPDNNIALRPEYQLLESQKKIVETSDKLTSLQNLPKLSGFGQAGYGRPGLNMLDNDFSGYYLIGIRLYWKPWNWHKVEREQKINRLRQEIITENQNTFTTEVQAELLQIQKEILKYENLMQSDREIIALKGNVVRTAEAQLSNGIITSSEYINQLNEETQAKINAENHKIQLINAKLNYKIALGKL